MRFAVVVFSLCLGALASVTNIWPQPVSVNAGADEVSMTNFTCVQTNYKSQLIQEACDRYAAMIPHASAPYVRGVTPVSVISVQISSSDETLQLGIDESYTVTIATSGIKVTAPTVYGALYGLETAFQCFDFDGARKIFVAKTVSVADKPRFPWRGILLDTSRHFLPLEFLKSKVVPALAMNKMNTMHIHLVDAQSWPLVVPEYPLLAGKGAFAPEATFTAQDLADLVETARRRGVRVVPEVDVPGHAYAVGMGYPALVAHCPAYEHNINNIPVDPTNNETYALLQATLAVLRRACPDNYVHMGGDEVVLGCWKQDAAIMSWASAHGLASANALEGYFESRLQPLVAAAQRTMVVWEEAWREKAISLDPSVVVEAWQSVDMLHQIVAAGYRGLLAAPWYLDKTTPVAGSTHYGFIDTWRDFYAADPETGSIDEPVEAPANANLILGGEAAMWGEAIDEASFEGRVWPRACAVAERLWSPKSVTDLDSAAPRLNDHSCRMKRRGVPSGPVLPQSYCPLLH